MVTAQMVKELRERTGAPMMDCKSALTETQGDMEKAVDFLRKKGLAAAAKKAGRIAAEGAVGSYIHGGGKLGVLVEVNCETDFVARTDQFQELVRDIAMHIAAAEPRFLSRNDVTQKDLDTEREIAKDAALKSGKPENIVEKMVSGKMEKFYGEACLLEQPYIRDDKQTVTQYLGSRGKEAGCQYVVTRFTRYKLGEGIEKRSEDFAAEVASYMK